MIARLGLPALVRGDDEADDRRGPDPGEHVREEPLVPGDVDERELPTRGRRRPREPEIDRQPAPALFLPPVRFHPGQGFDQGRLPMIDVPSRRDDEHQVPSPRRSFVTVCVAVSVMPGPP